MRRITLLLSCLMVCAVSAQRSPFTGHDPIRPDSTGSYRLLFGGHFHGASSSRSGYPAATLLASLDTINALKANALFSTGDLFLDANADRERYARSLFTKLDLALFNAPGNHDVEGSSYARSFGPTYGSVSFGEDLVVWLDTERDNGDIVGDQLVFLRKAVQDFSGRFLFVVSHRPLWAEGDPVYSDLFAGNTRSLLPSNFRKEVLPLLRQVAGSASVHWISGSMAGKAPSSIFFQQHEPNITYVQCAIRDLPRDAILMADIRGDSIRWAGISLTGRKLGPVEGMDAEWWRRSISKREGPNLRLIPLRITEMLTAPAFWSGVLAMVLLQLLFRRLLRRWL
jgi:hypothetical protein